MSTKKRIAKFLRKEAEKLAPEQYQAFHRYFKMEYHKDGDQAYPVYGEIGTHEVNHGRRLKKLYQKYGKAGVDKYFNDRGFKLVSKDESNNTAIKQREPRGSGDSQDIISEETQGTDS